MIFRLEMRKDEKREKLYKFINWDSEGEEYIGMGNCRDKFGREMAYRRPGRMYHP